MIKPLPCVLIEHLTIAINALKIKESLVHTLDANESNKIVKSLNKVINTNIIKVIDKPVLCFEKSIYEAISDETKAQLNKYIDVMIEADLHKVTKLEGE